MIDEVIFSERDRAMLKRSVIDDVTYEAIAEELDLSVTAVKKHVQCGRNVLIRYL
ncbi:MAG: sigma factor-like helix-turn-helix DNA-binding protein [Candidatus Limiplasma sp.]|nr:sigma factor-like helix-turn-helix DNA-binding protein [Candidatus Limiplasma sp.]